MKKTMMNALCVSMIFAVGCGKQEGSSPEAASNLSSTAKTPVRENIDLPVAGKNDQADNQEPDFEMFKAPDQGEFEDSEMDEVCTAQDIWGLVPKLN